MNFSKQNGLIIKIISLVATCMMLQSVPCSLLTFAFIKAEESEIPLVFMFALVTWIASATLFVVAVCDSATMIKKVIEDENSPI